MRKRTPLGPSLRPMSRGLGGSQGGGRFLMGEVPLYHRRTILRVRVISAKRRTASTQSEIKSSLICTTSRRIPVSASTNSGTFLKRDSTLL